MPTRKITIHSVCKTTPQQARMGGSTGFDEVQWRGSNSLPICLLQLPGGIFVDHPDPFDLTIAGTGWQPVSPLRLVPNAPNTLLSRYVFKISGSGCLINEPPPEIIIEANFRPRKTPAKRK